jgi:uncharacterized protein YecT (DUF1311 family)
MRRVALIAAIVMLAGTARADDGLVFSTAAIDACFAAGNPAADCIGASAQACMADTPGGYATPVMAGCFERELTYWDDALNTAYGDLDAQLRALDEDAADLPEGATRAESLHALQRAWVAFRDARCGYERSLWGSGSGAGPAQIACLMAETARQALYLEEQSGME